MSVVGAAAPPGAVRVTSAQDEGSFMVRTFGPAYPLKLLLLGFPLWWALGLASFAFLIAAGVMAGQLWRRRGIRLPRGFGIWVLFLGWMLLGGFLLYAHAPGTIDGGGAERLVGFLYRVLWYLAVTVAMLYTMNLPERQVPAAKVLRWLGFLFAVAIVGGVAGLLFPRFEFTSLAELVLPGANSGFIQTKVHPELSTVSDFLGYEQARPKAPFTYANAWGNNVGLLLPAYAYAVARARRPAVRWAGGLLMLVALVPIVYSLNRGLWLGLGLTGLYGLVLLAVRGRWTAVWTGVAVPGLLVVGVALSPVGQTIVLRLETPHSNDRRTTVADVVIRTTLEGSPVLGYGTNRQVIGSFSSLAGGGNPDCHNCAAPPLGTQGFTWRLIFTTGFPGVALFALFFLVQLLSHIRERDPVHVIGCMMIVMSGVFFMVYDSLESPLFLLMLVLGLMSRRGSESTGAALQAGPSVTENVLSRELR